MEVYSFSDVKGLGSFDPRELRNIQDPFARTIDYPDATIGDFKDSPLKPSCDHSYGNQGQNNGYEQSDHPSKSHLSGKSHDQSTECYGYQLLGPSGVIGSNWSRRHRARVPCATSAS